MVKDKPERSKVLAAIAQRSFPPVIKYPESQKDSLLSTWFSYPTLTWVPECLTPNRKPTCIVQGCPCEPKVKEYMQHVVEDVEHKTVLYYARYSCSGLSGRSFSTIDDDYISSSKMLLLKFPYLLTYKSGISVEMFDIVFDSMLSTKGIAGAVSNILRRRQKRYFRTLAYAGVVMETRRTTEATYSPPLPPTAEQYMANNACIDADTLRDIWLTHTNIYTTLCEAQMADTVWNCAIRLDHSQKFCSKLKVHGSDNSKVQPSSIRLLLLVQNEVGQIMGRALTRSENHAETEIVLRALRAKMKPDTEGPRVCVCDNANANRNLVQKVFGEAVAVKQDPFHVIQRFTEKIKEPAKRKWLAGELSAAIYDIERNLRTPVEMESQVQNVLASIPQSYVSVKESEWKGCVASNLEQIRRGDLYVSDNQYVDEGGSTRIVSTSQLEGIHSKLRKLLDRVVSIQVGLRILDIFILQHNLKTGAKHHRNPAYSSSDFMSVCQSALLCKGILPELPQLEYMHRLLSRGQGNTDQLDQIYRPGAEQLAVGQTWDRLYRMIPLDTNRMEAVLLRHTSRTADIRELLTRVHIKNKPLSEMQFVKLLGLEPEYDAAVDFSSHEFALLKELRSARLVSKRSWAECAVVATVLYNTAVLQLNNPCLGLKKRGFRSIAKRLDAIDEHVRKHSSQTATMFTLFSPGPSLINDEKVSIDEESLMKHLFELVRDAPGVSKKKQVYYRVYDFASSICADISPKSKAHLLRQWERLKRSNNRNKKKKIEVDPGSASLNEVDDNTHKSPTEAQVGWIANTDVTVETPTQSVEVPLSESSNVEGCTTMSASELGTSYLDGTVPAPVVSTNSVPVASILDFATIQHLKTLAASIPKRSRGKWQLIRNEYLRLHPGSTLTENALRCRLRERPKKRAPDNTNVLPSQAALNAEVAVAGVCEASIESTKRPPPACNSCRARKRRCGPSSSNPQCEQRKNAMGGNISSYFTQG